MKRYVSLNVEAAKEIKQRPIDGDFEQLLDETRDKLDQLQHLSMHQSLRKQLEDTAKTVRDKHAQQ